MKVATQIKTYIQPTRLGLVIHWAVEDDGFGELTLTYDREHGTWRIDDESMLESSLIAVLQHLDQKDEPCSAS